MATTSKPRGPAGIEGTLFELVSATASVVGAEYFRTTVEHLAHALEAGTAFLCEFVDEGQAVAAIATWPAQEALTGTRFQAADSAAGVTREGAPALHPAKVKKLFPRDVIVEALGLDSFAAVPIYSASGRPNGYLGIGDRGRLNAALPAEAILRLVAARAGAEVDRMQAERRLAEQGELLRMFTERALDIILRVRLLPEPTVDYVSPAFETISGYRCEELYNDPRLLMRMVHPEDASDYQKLFEGDQDQRQLWRFVTKAGETVWIDGRRIAVRDDAGRVIAYETVARDVTNERKAQDAVEALATQQRQLLDAIPDAIVHVDRNGRILDFKRPANLEGQPADDSPVGRHISDLFPLDVVPLALSRLAAALSTGSLQTLRYEAVSDNDERVYEARVAPAGADEAIILVRDMTAADWMTKERQRVETRVALEEQAESHLLLRNPYKLTFREYTVLGLVAAGAGDKQIAADLGISVFTVSKHVSNILGKMGVSSRTEASVRAVQEGLLAR